LARVTVTPIDWPSAESVGAPYKVIYTLTWSAVNEFAVGADAAATVLVAAGCWDAVWS